MKIDEKMMRKRLCFFIEIIWKMIVVEKCLMQNNVLKPMNFNDFSVRRVQRTIEEISKKR